MLTETMVQLLKFILAVVMHLSLEYIYILAVLKNALYSVSTLYLLIQLLTVVILVLPQMVNAVSPEHHSAL